MGPNHDLRIAHNEAGVRAMRKNKERERVREYLRAVRLITCVNEDCRKVNRKTNAEVMMHATLPCEFCGRPLPKQTTEQVLRPPRKSIDEKISEKGRRS